MFTGIVQCVGEVASCEAHGEDRRLHIHAPDLDLGSARLGDSIAVDGVCLTAVALSAAGFAADVSGETLRATTLGRHAPGHRVNLEPALTASAPLGGHLVSGHVDGVGEVLECAADARSVRVRFRVPEPLARYVARKGSVCVDGVSLTVNEIHGRDFEVNLVPHTLAQTTFSELAPGRAVNIEVDLIARYLERLLSARDAPD